MAGQPSVRGQDGFGPLRGHVMWSVAPALARRVEVALTDHVTEGTRKGYVSHIKSYTSFLTSFGGLPAFPVDAGWLCAYIIYICMDISVSSIKVYLCGIKYGQGCVGLP